MSLLEDHEAIVCDLDGVVYRGEHAVPHAVEVLRSAGRPVIYATNNASRRPSVVAEHLRRLGLDASEGDVATSSQAAAWLLTHHVSPGSRVLAVGGEGVAAALQERGFVPVTRAGEGPEAVVQGYGPAVTATDLAQAAYAIQAGALWVATNTDRTLPTSEGFAPGNGAMVDAVAAATGRRPDHVAGKPADPLYLLCAERLGVPADRVLAVGDRLETDIEGAHRAGMNSLLVLTGVHSREDAADAAPPCRPTWIAPDLRGLRADHSELDEAMASLHDGWRRRDAAATASMHPLAGPRPE